MSDPVQTACALVLVALGCASLFMWAIIFGRLRAGEAVIRAEPRFSTGALDLYIAFAVCLAVVFAYTQATNEPDAAPRTDTLDAVDLLTQSVLSLSAIAIALVFLGFRRGPHFVRAMFSSRPRTDLVIGFLTFVAAFTPIFTIQFVLTRYFPSQHPVQILLTKDASPGVLALCIFSAVVVAPLAEELVLRVLLQGGMEGMVLQLRSRERQSSLDQEDVGSAQIDSSPQIMPWPILLSSLTFALLHLGHGTDPIPLFVFAVILGYVYQKTHRIWPGLIAHACLNAWSLTVLWLSLRMGWAE